MEGLLVVTIIAIAYGRYRIVTIAQDMISSSRVKKILESRKG